MSSKFRFQALFGKFQISKFQFPELRFFKFPCPNSPVQNGKKSDLSETIGIDSGGLEQLFDVLFRLVRAIFQDVLQNMVSGDRYKPILFTEILAGLKFFEAFGMQAAWCNVEAHTQLRGNQFGVKLRPFLGCSPRALRCREYYSSSKSWDFAPAYPRH